MAPHSSTHKPVLQKPEKISDAEYQVMEVLWEEAPLAAADVAAVISPMTGWSLNTVKTLLARLADKRALTHEQDGRRYLYSPAISREDHAKSETRQFADRLFGGRAAPLVAHLAKAPGGLSEDDIDALQALLEDLKENG